MPAPDHLSESERSPWDSCSMFSGNASASTPTSPEIADGKENDTHYSCPQYLSSQNTGQTHFAYDPAKGLTLGVIRVHNVLQSNPVDLANCVCIAGPHAGTAFPAFSINVLVERGWMRIEVIENQRHTAHYSVRISFVPEIFDHHARKSFLLECRKHLKHVIAYVDKSKSVWDGDWSLDTPFESYIVCPEQESLFYLFNTLSSPSPMPESIVDSYARQAVEDILDNSVAGLKTKLYPYQKRSAAVIVQRETTPKRSLDPRKTCFRGPTGQSFYYDKEEGTLLLRPVLYEEPRGGILAETMGYGKTLICLAVILASRGHYSRVPGDRIEIPMRARKTVASLAEMAVARIIDHGIPWKADFHDLATKGYYHDRCLEMLRSSFKEYTERLLTPQTPNRNGKRRTEKAVRLCSSTLIIVPPNLFIQWQQEITKHTEDEALDVLAIDQTCKTIPKCDELARYDIVLITKGRFDQEYRDDDLNTGRRVGSEEQYQSPLTDLRWLRVILDEGVGFASTATRTNAMAMLDKMYFDRRWVVSGTPSNSLRGVEVNLAANETMSEEETEQNDLQGTLDKRRKSDILDRENQDLDKLRMIVTRFLKVHPWANTPGFDHANWTRYLAPYDRRGQRRNVIGLRALLESIIVRHTIQDIEIDLSLPPLHNKVVYLEPSYYDKLSLNLFSAVLVSNAVTSERTDEDYMFHPKNRKQLDILINNLRQSSFHWVGFKRHDLEESIRIGKKYMKGNAEKISSVDRDLLVTAIRVWKRAINDPCWLSFSTLHDIGVFVKDFPKHASEAWAFGKSLSPLLMGTVQARAAQQYIEEHVKDDDPAEGLTGAGLRAMQSARKRAADEDKTAAKNRAPGSQVVEEPKIKDQTKRKRSLLSSPEDSPNKRVHLYHSTRSQSLPGNSPLHLTTITGFSSSKLAYLIDQLTLHHTTSKTLIFYDTNNVAFWLAEALELFSFPFLIYANTLPPKTRSHYLSVFNEPDSSFRILLMDIRQASHGLHIAAADRVYIITPIWQPNVEAQAIKRAHRIGQTKPVYVETLVLKGTLEERMIKRRKEMSSVELRCAERSLLDDGRMQGIIREGIGFLDFKKDELNGMEGRVARLRMPQKLFARTVTDDQGLSEEGKGRSGGVNDGHPISEQGHSPTQSQSQPQPPPSKRVRIVLDQGSSCGIGGSDATAREKPPRPAVSFASIRPRPEIAVVIP